MSSGPRHLRRLGALAVTAAATVALLAGCSGSSDDASPKKVDDPGRLLSGPTANIQVQIPDGWHQVINSGNPIIPEMVFPSTCVGATEVSCAYGLARIASTVSPSMEAAAKEVEQAVATAPGITEGPTVSEGPGKVGHRDGYRHRFLFKSGEANLTAEVAIVPSGPQVTDAKGNHEYSVILVWISDKPNSPAPKVIDEIVDSGHITGGQQPQ